MTEPAIPRNLGKAIRLADQLLAAPGDRVARSGIVGFSSRKVSGWNIESRRIRRGSGVRPVRGSGRDGLRLAIVVLEQRGLVRRDDEEIVITDRALLIGWVAEARAALALSDRQFGESR